MAVEGHVEYVLAPTLVEGQAVVVDNLSAHNGDKLKERTKERGCGLLYLPPYSPDLNPIRRAFSEVKRSLRTIGARTREALP
jgi:transposase